MCQNNRQFIKNIFNRATKESGSRLYIGIRNRKEIIELQRIYYSSEQGTVFVVKAGNTDLCFINNQINGKLIVTNQRIYFKTLREETENFNLEILFDNIREVIFYSRGLLFGVKGLNVVTRDGKSFSFPLKKRDEIGQLINKMY